MLVCVDVLVIVLFLFGDCSYDKLTQTAAQIRSFKRPEPYKGKGILYDQEKILLKKGKKIWLKKKWKEKERSGYEPSKHYYWDFS